MIDLVGGNAKLEIEICQGDETTGQTVIMNRDSKAEPSHDKSNELPVVLERRPGTAAETSRNKDFDGKGKNLTDFCDYLSKVSWFLISSCFFK